MIYPEEGVIKVKDLCAHEVLGTNSAEDHDVTPNALITEDTNTAAGIKTSKGLGHLGGAYLVSAHIHMCGASYLVVKASLPDHVDEDVISLAGDLDSLWGNVAKNSDGNSRSVFDLVSRYFKAGG